MLHFILLQFQDDTLLKENDQYFFKHDYQELNIKYLKQHDSGKYWCRATNRLGTSEMSQQIIVKRKACKFYKHFYIFKIKLTKN